MQVGSLSEIEERFWRNVQGAVGSFAVKYCALADWSKIKSASGPADCIDMVREVIRDNHLPPLYVIIDEYDNFTNELVVSGRELEYNAVCGHDAKGDATRESFFKAFFKSFKSGLADGTVGRTYFTGVLQSGARLQEGACPPPRLEPRDPRCRRRSVRQHRLQLVRPAVPLTGRNQGDGASND